MRAEGSRGEDLMRYLVMGAVTTLAGGAYCGGAFSQADVVRVISKPPAQVYSDFHVILNASDDRMETLATSLDGETRKERVGDDGLRLAVHDVPGREIDYSITKDGQAFLRIDVRFEGVDNDQRTKVLANVELHDVPGVDLPLRGFAAYGFKRMVRRAVDDLAVSIEQDRFGDYARTFAQRGYDGSSAAEERWRQREAQRHAVQPMLDPERERLHPTGKSAEPMTRIGT